MYTLKTTLMVLLIGSAFICQAIFIQGFESSDLPQLSNGSGIPSDRHTSRELGTTTAAQGYYEYLPPGYDLGNQVYPLLVFIHGLQENGNGSTELSRVLAQGPPKMINQNNWDENLPFVVLSPQNSNGGCTSSNNIRDFIDYAVANYDINPDRVYLTGLSCGAIGSWNYLRNNGTSQIAAMVPIAGDGRGAFNNAGCALGLTPIWAFHGDNDNTVNEIGTIEPINNILACNTTLDDVSMVIYPGVGHDSWTQTYNLNAGHDIYNWMLQHRNSAAFSP